MSVTRGRVIATGELRDSARPVAERAAPVAPRARVAPRAIVDASERAARIVDAAEARARELLAAAERDAATVRLRAEEEGRADGAAGLAAKAIALHAREAAADEHALDRAVALARLLAERVLGEELSLAPDKIASLARAALAEAKGARRATIVAHPEDATILERAIAGLGLDADAIRIQKESGRARGNLRVETDIGVLDAALAPQLERLALKLRETLRGRPEHS